MGCGASSKSQNKDDKPTPTPAAPAIPSVVIIEPPREMPKNALFYKPGDAMFKIFVDDHGSAFYTGTYSFNPSPIQQGKGTNGRKTFTLSIWGSDVTFAVEILEAGLGLKQVSGDEVGEGGLYFQLHGDVKALWEVEDIPELEKLYSSTYSEADVPPQYRPNVKKKAKPEAVPEVTPTPAAAPAAGEAPASPAAAEAKPGAPPYEWGDLWVDTCGCGMERLRIDLMHKLSPQSTLGDLREMVKIHKGYFSITDFTWVLDPDNETKTLKELGVDRHVQLKFMGTTTEMHLGYIRTEHPEELMSEDMGQVWKTFWFSEAGRAMGSSS